MSKLIALAASVATLTVLALSACGSTPPAAAAIAAPAPPTAEQAFLTELAADAPRFGVENDAVRGAQFVQTARNTCTYLTVVSGAQRMAAAQYVATEGHYSLPEGLLFTNLAVKHFCPTYADPQVVTTVAEAPVQPVVSYPLTTFGDGTYLIGTEVTAGNYVSEGAETCYWEIDRQSPDKYGSTIIKNGNANGHTNITIPAGAYSIQVTSSDGCTFTKR